MFIETQSTPNPATLRFLPGREVLRDGTAVFTEAAEAERSPLAKRLLQIDGITGVFLARDAITCTKAEGLDWYDLKPQVLGTIMEHFAAGRPVMADGVVPEPTAERRDWGPDQEIVDQIVELLDTRVRPRVAEDGGDIVFQGFEKGIVYLHMQGSCAGCPSSTATLKSGIETLLRHYVPEVVEVRAVD